MQPTTFSPFFKTERPINCIFARILQKIQNKITQKSVNSLAAFLTSKNINYDHRNPRKRRNGQRHRTSSRDGWTRSFGI